MNASTSGTSISSSARPPKKGARWTKDGFVVHQGAALAAEHLPVVYVVPADGRNVDRLEADGRALASSTHMLSQDDTEHPDFAELLLPLILDWAEMARRVDEYAREINNMA
jgi:hypothetical protein